MEDTAASCESLPGSLAHLLPTLKTQLALSIPHLAEKSLPDNVLVRFLVQRQGDIKKIIPLLQSYHTWYYSPLSHNPTNNIYGAKVSSRSTSSSGSNNITNNAHTNIAHKPLLHLPNLLRNFAPADLLTLSFPSSACTNAKDISEVLGDALYDGLQLHSFQGQDLEGRPIYWERSGRLAAHLSELRRRYGEDTLLVRHIRDMERLQYLCQHPQQRKQTLEVALSRDNTTNNTNTIHTNGDRPTGSQVLSPPPLSQYTVVMDLADFATSPADTVDYEALISQYYTTHATHDGSTTTTNDHGTIAPSTDSSTHDSKSSSSSSSTGGGISDWWSRNTSFFSLTDYLPIIQFITRIHDIDRHFYPETLAQVIILHPPRVWQWLQHAILPLLPVKTKEKLHFIDISHTATTNISTNNVTTNSSTTTTTTIKNNSSHNHAKSTSSMSREKQLLLRQALLPYIAVEHIPEEYGGDCVDFQWNSSAPANIYDNLWNNTTTDESNSNSNSDSSGAANASDGTANDDAAIN